MTDEWLNRVARRLSLARGRDAARRATRPVRAMLAPFLPKAAILLTVLTFGSYAMGLLRDRMFARTFGAGSELDAYNAAFALPEVALDVLVAGGLAAPFVPIFSGVRRDDQAAADDFGQTILTLAVLIMAVVSVVLFVLAPQTASLVAPGFDASQRERYVQLFRVMCLTPMIFAASITLGEVLVANRRFLAYGLAPVLYNGGIVLGTVGLSGRIGIFGPAAGAVLGALLHLGIRLLEIHRTSFRVRPRLAVRTPAVIEFARLMLPKMASQPIDPLTFLFFTALATTFGTGSVASIGFARNFQSAAVSLIAASFSIAVFPTLSAAYAAGDRDGFVRVLWANLVTIAVLTMGAGLILLVFGRLIIEAFLGGGSFGATDVSRTALVLGAFALSVPLESVTHPLSRALYATRNTILPVGASLAGLIVTVVCADLLAGRAGLAAIPIAYTIGMGAKAALLAIAIVPRVRELAPEASGEPAGPA